VGGFRNNFHSKHFQPADEELTYIVPAKLMACTAIDLLADDAAKAKEVIEKFDSPYNVKNYNTIWEDIMNS
ncbi:MAG: amidohydrolase, partial [Oscillospiraceae bacterium]|nr:amidohydrolase [Oscillospiraceae bacterium]